MSQKRKIVEAFTDGACQGNPGPGGWGVILRYRGHEREFKGGEKDTTNNRMELLAAIKALQFLKEPVELHIYTDSQYLQKGITQWIRTWRNNDWKTSSKEDVKNIDLWKELDSLSSKHQIEWHWVRGHSGHPENERADALARAGMAPFQK